MATNAPLLTAVSTSARQILLLLRCISFAKKAQVRPGPDGLRLTAENGSVMEASVFLDKKLFTSYTYNQPLSQGSSTRSPSFEVNLIFLLEALNIFSLSDLNITKRPGEYDAFAAHRLNRHAGVSAFSNSAFGMTGTCTFTYDGPGCPLSIHMSEAGVTTTCDLTTYEAESAEEIPFDRENLALKTIMRSNFLLEAITELSNMSPTELTIASSPSERAGAALSLSATGALGSATVDFATNSPSETPTLETFQCPLPTSASFQFDLVKAAQRAMASAAKVSLRLDEEGVLSMQFLVEIDAAGASSDGSDGMAFVDFRVVPLVETEAGAETESDNSDE